MTCQCASPRSGSRAPACTATVRRARAPEFSQEVFDIDHYHTPHGNTVQLLVCDGENARFLTRMRSQTVHCGTAGDVTALRRSHWPIYGRGAGSVGRAFDARQKIGSSDVRQRLGVGGATAGKRIDTEAFVSTLASRASVRPAFPVKDAREKLAQKDARFRIRGRGGGAGAVHDARQTINSRKQQQTPAIAPVQPSPVKPAAAGIPHIHIHNPAPGARVGVALQPGGGLTKVVDARDRLSLKRSVPTASNQIAASMKITKTIQVSQQRPVGMTSGIRINVPSGAAPTLQPVSRTTVATQQAGGDAGGQTHAPPQVHRLTRPIRELLDDSSDVLLMRLTCVCVCVCVCQPVSSPLEGTKITVNNLHPRVTEEDIVELFCVCGALKRARLLKVGVAEVVFVRKEDAVSAYRKYNNRCLDGQPMKCNLHMQGSVITSEQPILLRLSDTPGAGGSSQKDSSSRSGSRSASTAEVDPQTILKALFKSSSQTGGTGGASGGETPNAHATAFRIKI
ncbi:polymerase delta-interacting protein 3 [Anabarilius grahami]|uniref:Polymerase delta-interacting protein 3 n=1 Tax=Anabarilius grahami TaxID=495550 RepID=A0A3N0Y1I6_ANAGA|nr:polymerase delta-interacting protein 3 [Anabarilius grahami]